jgi:hypothetical protein
MEQQIVYDLAEKHDSSLDLIEKIMAGNDLVYELTEIDSAFLDQGIHTSWETLRRQLSTHQVVTVRLPTADGRVLTIRRDTRPEKIHTEIYRVVRVPEVRLTCKITPLRRPDWQ